MPGFGVASPAFEMCMNRTSALQLYLLRKKCNPSAPDVVKFTRDVPGGTCVLVKSVPPPRSTYGVTLWPAAKFHFSAKGFRPIPYAVPLRWVSKNTGTTSTAYSNRPRKGPGPTASVRTHPYRTPRFHTPVSEVLPFSPCPPPVHTCSSFPPPSGPDCARIPVQLSRRYGAIRNSARKKVFTGQSPQTLA